MVGGSVRDLLLGKQPKDFDIATDARPEQVKSAFNNCILIGRRFRLAHVRFGREIIEVATFRAAETKKSKKHRHIAQHGMVVRDNIYGTLVEDVWRRDFTINALYYNIIDFTVVDYCGGMQDLQNKLLRLIGDPEKRYHEDPVRLLRIIRFAAKLNFTIEENSKTPIIKLAPLLLHIPAARLFEEILKLFHNGAAKTVLQLLIDYQLFAFLFPQTDSLLKTSQKAKIEKWLMLTCETTDQRINADKHVSPAFLFASMLWFSYQEKIKHFHTDRQPIVVAKNKAAHDVLTLQIKTISLPHRYKTAIKEIWNLQDRLNHPSAKQAFSLLHHPRFRAAYDFFVLRSKIDHALVETANWWTKLQAEDAETQEKMIEALTSFNPPKAKDH